MIEQELETVFWADDDGVVELGDLVDKIVLRNDGNGLSGYYDRIHVYHSNGTHYVYPAHNVYGWKLLNGD